MTGPFAGLRHSKLSIVVPVFNEARQITDNIALLIREVEEYFINFEIIVVSDGSTDGTNLKLTMLNHPVVRSLIVGKNLGKGHAVRAGFQMASGDYILFIDGGMEIHPKEIRTFVGLMALYNADIVIGSKRHPQSMVDYPTHRRFLSWLFQLLIRRLFDVDVTDTQVGIKLLRKPVVDAILPHLEVNRYGFDLELLSLAKRKGFRNMLEAPVRIDYFAKNRRPFLYELIHVLRVGVSLLKDTINLYRRLRRLEEKPLDASHQNHLKASGE